MLRHSSSIHLSPLRSSRSSLVAASSTRGDFDGLGSVLEKELGAFDEADQGGQEEHGQGERVAMVLGFAVVVEHHATEAKHEASHGAQEVKAQLRYADWTFPCRLNFHDIALFQCMLGALAAALSSRCAVS